VYAGQVREDEELELGGTEVEDAQVVAGGGHLNLIINGETYNLGGSAADPGRSRQGPRVQRQQLMPTVTEQRVDGYVSCIDPRCPGYEQRPVQVIKASSRSPTRSSAATARVPQTAIERETVGIVQTDETCEHCGKPVIFSDVERPEYAPVSRAGPARAAGHQPADADP
jgi:hypothetical protein